MVIYGVLFATALLSSLALTREVLRTSLRLGLTDRPGVHKVHVTPVPRLGGVAIAMALALALGVAVIIDTHAATGPLPDARSLLPIVCGGLIVFAVGLWDDLDPLGPGFKLGAQAAAAGVVIAAGLTIERVTVLGATHELGLIGIPVTLAWVLVITNAFNLLDGLDGLAGGLVAIAAVTCAIVLIARDELPSAMLLVSLAGAVLGFLAYNFHPARIFMGDSGALLSGFLLAVTAVTGRQKGATALAVSVPLFIFALPLADTLVAIVRRMGHRPVRSGDAGAAGFVQRIFTGDRRHIHHKLLQLGLSHRMAVLFLYLLMVLCSGVALMTMEVP
jgi:UDP-GlcNAc:undecaprenyl-phosphate/decaprenyl-phosphate GlcNAc-1-phosphate transferase